jgi:hypothetical protein
MPQLTQQQLKLLAQAAEVMTEIRHAALSTRTPKPAERIDVVPGVAALVVTGRASLSMGHYVLELGEAPAPENPQVTGSE